MLMVENDHLKLTITLKDNIRCRNMPTTESVLVPIKPLLFSAKMQKTQKRMKQANLITSIIFDLSERRHHVALDASLRRFA